MATEGAIRMSRDAVAVEDSRTSDHLVFVPPGPVGFQVAHAAESLRRDVMGGSGDEFKPKGRGLQLVSLRESSYGISLTYRETVWTVTEQGGEECPD